MKRGVPGETVAGDLWDKPALAFVPSPLPPTPTIRFTDRLAHKLDEAMLHLGRLGARTADSSVAGAVQGLLLRREALFSLAASGPSVSLVNLLRSEVGRQSDVGSQEALAAARNGVAALALAGSRGESGSAYAAEFLGELQRVLVGTRRRPAWEPRPLNAAVGAFRSAYAWHDVLRRTSRPNLFTPPELVPKAMKALEEFVLPADSVQASPFEAAPSMPALFKTGLAHAQFELIWPYLEEAARTNRVATLSQLRASGLIGGVVTLSRHFAKHRLEHEHARDAVRYSGDWEAWLEFFLDAVTGAVIDTQRVLSEASERLERDLEEANALGKAAPTARSVLWAMTTLPVTTTHALVATTGLTATTVNKALSSLVDKGLIAERTGQRRNRVYEYESLIEIVGRETGQFVPGRNRLTRSAPSYGAHARVIEGDA